MHSVPAFSIDQQYQLFKAYSSYPQHDSGKKTTDDSAWSNFEMHSFVSWQGIWKEKICWILYCVAIFHDAAVAFVVVRRSQSAVISRMTFCKIWLEKYHLSDMKRIKKDKATLQLFYNGHQQLTLCARVFFFRNLVLHLFCIIWNWMQNILWLSYAAIKRAWNSPLCWFCQQTLHF